MAPYKSYKSLEERTRVLRQMDVLGTSDLRQVSKELNVSISSLSRFLKERKRVASLAKYKKKKTSKAVEKKLRVANSQAEDAKELCVRKSVRFDCDVKGEAPDGASPLAPLVEEVSVKKFDDLEEKVPFFTGKWTPGDIVETSTPKSEKGQDHAPSITWRALSEAKGRQDPSKYPDAVEPTKREITAALSVLRRASETDLRMPLWCEFVSGRLQERIPLPSVVGGPWGWEVAEAVGTINDALRTNSGSAMWLRFALKNLF